MFKSDAIKQQQTSVIRRNVARAIRLAQVDIERGSSSWLVLDSEHSDLTKRRVNRVARLQEP